MVSRSVRPSLVPLGWLLVVALFPGMSHAQAPSDPVTQVQAEAHILRKELRKLRSDLHRAQSDLDRAQAERNSLAKRSSELEEAAHAAEGRMVRLEWGLAAAILLGLTALAARARSRGGASAGNGLSPRELDPLRAGIRALEGRLSAVERTEPASRESRAAG